MARKVPRVFSSNPDQPGIGCAVDERRNHTVSGRDEMTRRGTRRASLLRQGGPGDELWRSASTFLLRRAKLDFDGVEVLRRRRRCTRRDQKSASNIEPGFGDGACPLPTRCFAESLRDARRNVPCANTVLTGRVTQIPRVRNLQGCSPLSRALVTSRARCRHPAAMASLGVVRIQRVERRERRAACVDARRTELERKLCSAGG